MPQCFGGMGPHLLPLAVFIILPATFITTYVIAVLLKHVSAEFPYISDTGTKSPESCIFGQLLNISAVLIAATVYVKYKQVQEYNSHSTHMLRVNLAALYLGWLAAFGLSLVANFQETNVLVVHLIGAVMAFGIGAIYSSIQTYMSYKMAPRLNSKCLAHFRLFLSILITVSFISTFACGEIARHLCEHDPQSYFKIDWDKCKKGFTAHIISTASEWVLALGVLLFFTTYIKEFQQIVLVAPQVHLLVMGDSLLQNEYNDQQHFLGE